MAMSIRSPTPPSAPTISVIQSRDADTGPMQRVVAVHGDLYQFQVHRTKWKLLVSRMTLARRIARQLVVTSSMYFTGAPPPPSHSRELRYADSVELAIVFPAGATTSSIITSWVETTARDLGARVVLIPNDTPPRPVKHQ